jgi:hypothetical protein
VNRERNRVYDPEHRGEMKKKASTGRDLSHSLHIPESERSINKISPESLPVVSVPISTSSWDLLRSNF